MHLINVSRPTSLVTNSCTDEAIYVKRSHIIVACWEGAKKIIIIRKKPRKDSIGCWKQDKTKKGQDPRFLNKRHRRKREPIPAAYLVLFKINVWVDSKWNFYHFYPVKTHQWRKLHKILSIQ